MTSHVTATALQNNGGEAFLGRRMRLAADDDFASPSNPDGIILPRPSLRRAANCEPPTYGEQALELGVMYTFGGCSDGRTFVFINENTGMPLQIYCTELPCAVFVLEQ